MFASYHYLKRPCHFWKPRALNAEQCKGLIALFTTDRAAWLATIEQASREPVLPDGGHLSTCEVGMPPYPKVYDMRAMSEQDHVEAEKKFGCLHVNTADNVGVDEVMALVAGGPWTWFFAFPNQSVDKLSLSRITPAQGQENQGWSISYPGLTPHGAFMNAPTAW
jgi:hypothetical protein